MVTTTLAKNSQVTKRKYRLPPYEVLIKYASPKQIAEAERLRQKYGDKDHDIAIRYLSIATTGELIKNFEPSKTSDFWLEELPKSLPLNWEGIVQKQISDKPVVALYTVFKILFPEEILDEIETLDIMDFLIDKLKEWGWQSTDNARIFKNPWIQQLTLDLIFE